MMLRSRKSVTLACLLGWAAACSSNGSEVAEQGKAAALASADGLVSAVISMQSDWGTGYCANIHLTNTGSTPTSSWSVVMNLNGTTFSNGWSAKYAVSGTELTATPESYNATVPANGSIDIGFCGTASGTNRPSITSVSQTGSSGDAGAGGSAAGGTNTGGSATGGATAGGSATGGAGTSTGPATLSYQSQWNGGYCANITVTNTGSTPTTSWTVVLNMSGTTVTSAWSASFATSGGEVTATPLGYNAAIAPGGSVTFGLCANGSGRPVITSSSLALGSGGSGGTGGTPASGGTTATGGTALTGGTAPSGGTTATGGTGSSSGPAALTYQSSWDTGYCANVAVANSGSTAASSWTVIIDLNGSTLGSSWDGTFANDSGRLTVTPAPYNATIPAGGSAKFGFCGAGTGRPTIVSASVTAGGTTVGTGGASGGTAATGGAATGGAPTGGKATGGAPTGGAPTGGKATGGAPTGGAPTGGKATGGAPTGGAPTGGKATGGAATGGSNGGTTVPPLTNGTQGRTTRYWDCCKPSCAWRANAQAGGKSSPATACAKDGTTTVGENTQSTCSGGSAYQCSWGAPWAVSSTLSYGFAAYNGTNCGKCYQLDFTGSGDNAGAQSLQGKSMIVQAVNIGGIAANQFDLLIPGGGVGANNACTGSNGQWGNVDSGATYGGFLATCGNNMNCITNMCQSAFGSFSGLMAGCDWFTGWFAAANNPGIVYAEVACPAEITNRSGLR